VSRGRAREGKGGEKLTTERKTREGKLEGLAGPGHRTLLLSQGGKSSENLRNRMRGKGGTSLLGYSPSEGPRGEKVEGNRGGSKTEKKHCIANGEKKTQMRTQRDSRLEGGGS